MQVYLASPLGFNPEYSDYRKRITAHLEAQGHTVFDPWEQQDVSQRITTAIGIYDLKERQTAITAAAEFAGRMNAEGIRSSDALLAVLDGAEADSGTVAELGFAAGLGKKCFGLRTDTRNMSELPGLPVNLQVLYFITSTGGELYRTISDIKTDI